MTSEPLPPSAATWFYRSAGVFIVVEAGIREIVAWSQLLRGQHVTEAPQYVAFIVAALCFRVAGGKS